MRRAVSWSAWCTIPPGPREVNHPVTARILRATTLRLRFSVLPLPAGTSSQRGYIPPGTSTAGTASGHLPLPHRSLPFGPYRPRRPRSRRRRPRRRRRRPRRRRRRPRRRRPRRTRRTRHPRRPRRHRPHRRLRNARSSAGGPAAAPRLQGSRTRTKGTMCAAAPTSSPFRSPGQKTRVALFGVGQMRALIGTVGVPLRVRVPRIIVCVCRVGTPMGGCIFLPYILLVWLAFCVWATIYGP